MYSDCKKVNYNEWLDIRAGYFERYPIPPIIKSRIRHYGNTYTLRLDIELSYPRECLLEVPVSFNPHTGPYESHDLFYSCDDWSVIFDVHRIDPTPHEDPTLRMLVESGHANPFGEKIALMSTARTIFHQGWVAKNWNDFAFFRGKYWKLTWNENFGKYPRGLMNKLPFVDFRSDDDFGKIDDMDAGTSSLFSGILGGGIIWTS